MVVVLQKRGIQFLEVNIVADNEAAIYIVQRVKVNIKVAEYDLFGENNFRVSYRLRVRING